MNEQDTNAQRFSVSMLGLGYMGSALARAFLAKQHAVTVWNRTASKARTPGRGRCPSGRVGGRGHRRKRRDRRVCQRLPRE